MWQNFVELMIRIQLGLVPNFSIIRGFGRASGLSSATPNAAIWPLGATIPTYPWITSAGKLRLKSDNVGDAPGGAGCQSVLVQGLGPTRLPISETVILDGTSYVQTVQDFLRVNSMIGMLPGVANAEVTNLGLVQAETLDGTVRSVMPAGDGMSQGSQYSPPADSVALLFNVDVQMEASSGSTERHLDGALWFRNAQSGQIYRRPRRIVVSNSAGKANLEPRTLIAVPAGTDFQLQVQTIDSASLTAVTGAFEGILVQNLSLRQN
jgi:hypothetical protein